MKKSILAAMTMVLLAMPITSCATKTESAQPAHSEALPQAAEPMNTVSMRK